VAYVDHPVVKYITFDSTGSYLDNTHMCIVNVHFCDGSEVTWQNKYFEVYNVGQMGISITPDGTKIFAQTWKNGLYCFDIRTGEKLWRTKSRAGITDMHVNRNGTICAHKHYRALQLIDIETGEVLKEKTPARSWGFQILDENRILCQTKARLCEIIDPATLDTIDSFHPFDLDHLHQYAKSIRHNC